MVTPVNKPESVTIPVVTRNQSEAEVVTPVVTPVVTQPKRDRAEYMRKRRATAKEG